MFFFVFYVEYNKKRILASVDTVNNLQFGNTNVEKTSTELQPATDIVKLASHFGKANQTGSQGKIKTKLFSSTSKSNPTGAYKKVSLRKVKKSIITDKDFLHASAECSMLAGISDADSAKYKDRMCDMFSSQRDYAVGTWVKNCNKASALKRQANQIKKGLYSRVDNAAVVDPFIYSNYYRSVTGTPQLINAVWDGGDRARVCYGPQTMKAVPKTFDQKINSLFYTWKPATCYLKAFNAMKMVNILKKQLIVFVGDSLTKQFAHSLWSLTRLRPAYIRTNLLFNDKTLRPMDSIELQLCEQCKKFKYFPNDKGHYHSCEMQTKFCPTEFMEIGEGKATNKGSKNPAKDEGSDMSFLEYSEYDGSYQDWSRFLPEAKIFVINMGAHLHNIFPNLPKGATMEKIADNLAAFIAKSSFKGLLVWMKTPIYAPNCDAAAKPRQMDEGVYKYNNSDAMLHSWDVVQKQQKLGIFEKAFRKRKELEGRFTVLDVAPTNLRIDQHPGKNKCRDCEGKYADCLHFCYPGGQDFWIQFLYNIVDQYFEDDQGK